LKDDRTQEPDLDLQNLAEKLPQKQPQKAANM